MKLQIFYCLNFNSILNSKLSEIKRAEVSNGWGNFIYLKHLTGVPCELNGKKSLITKVQRICLMTHTTLLQLISLSQVLDNFDSKLNPGGRGRGAGHQMGLVLIKLLPLPKSPGFQHFNKSSFTLLATLEFDFCWAKSGWQKILSKNVEQKNYNSNPLFRLGYSPSSPFIFQVHCFQDFSRLGKSLSTLWSIRDDDSEEFFTDIILQKTHLDLWERFIWIICV